jgi:DNA-binding CsgD family transcriptional regulator
VDEVVETSTAAGILPLQWPLVGRQAELDEFAAALEDPRAHGLVITGPPGVGKTRLADECLALAAGRGRTVGRATATEGAHHVPLGLLAHLLPPTLADPHADLAAVFNQVTRALREAGGPGSNAVILIDDLHLVDSTSAALIAQVVDSGLMFLVGTVRTGDTAPPALASLWQRARVRRIDLGDLSREDVDALLPAVLSGPVSGRTSTRIWSVSGGNALFVRELVIAALTTGGLLERRGVWGLRGEFVTTARLTELVETRLQGMRPQERDALTALAVWEPVGLSMLEDMVGVDALRALDGAGLLTVRTEGRRQQVSLAHPLYGDVTRATLSPLVRRRLLLDHADRVDAHGARRREDPVRLATARLDADGHADPELLVAAARLARYAHDYREVERLARAAISDEMTTEAGLLLGEALHISGAHGESEEVLARAEAAATGMDTALVLAVQVRARNLMWGLLRNDEALAITRDARGRVTDAAHVGELMLTEAILLTYSGRPLEALEVAHATGHLQEPRARAVRALAEVPALAGTGQCETAIGLASRAYEHHAAMADQIAIAHPGIHRVFEAYALNEAGRMTDAITVAAEAYRTMTQTYAGNLTMWLAYQLGRSALLRGQAQTASRWFSEATARSQSLAIASPQRLSLSGLATAHALLGEAERAAAAFAELDTVPESAFARPEHELGRAWAAVAAGDIPRAVAVLLEAADLAATMGYRSGEAWLLHDAARLGDPRRVAPRLRTLASACEGALVPAYAFHAAAAVANRPEDLAAAADRFESIGANLLAAEAATAAAHAYQGRGERRAATGLSARATRLVKRCEGARTPGLLTAETVAPLTRRERDVAALAASGVASREIGARLYLSVRTVNNHLQSVYTKLGVSSRAELAEALKQPEPPP